MGGVTSSVVKSVTSSAKWFSRSKTGDGKTDQNSNQFYGATPFVYKRRGSMYMDEDGDLAHEFYEQVPVGSYSKKYKMVKKSHKYLIPQGEIDLPHPRLHVDFPAILYDMSTTR